MRSPFVFAAVAAFFASAFSLSSYAAPLQTLTVEATRRGAIDETRDAPFQLAYQAEDDTLWTVNNGSDSLTVRDAGDLHLVRRLSVGHQPQCVALDARRHRAFVVNSGDNSLSRIDTVSFSLVEKIEVDSQPQMAVIDDKTGRVWVTNRDSDTVSVYNPDSGEVRRLRTGKAPVGIALDSVNHRVYVANSGAKNLCVFNSEDGARQTDIDLPASPMTLAVNASTGVICSTLSGDNSVALTLMHAPNQTRRVRVGQYPIGVVCDAQSGLFFVSNSGSRSVCALDSNGTVLDTFSTGQEPIGLAVRPQGERGKARVFAAACASATFSCFELPHYDAAQAVQTELFAPKHQIVPDDSNSVREVLGALPSAPQTTALAPQSSARNRPASRPANRPNVTEFIAPTPVVQWSPETNRAPRTNFAPRPSRSQLRSQLPRVRSNQAAPVAFSGQSSSPMRLPVFPASVDARRISAPIRPRLEISASPLGQASALFGGVKGHVAQSGLQIKQLFGVKTVLGVGKRGGASDHPGGLALDFCVGEDSAKGDQIAVYMLQHAEEQHVNYVIWKRHIRNPRDTEWRDQGDKGSPTANHMDHVHVSYLP